MSETFKCPGFNGWGKPDASWIKRDGFRTCSYCGSIHPEDWVKAVRDAVATGGQKMNIDRGKPGKWYARGANDAGEKAWGKFYAYHMPPDMAADLELDDQLRRALRASWDRLFRHRDKKSAVERLGDVADDG